MITQKSSISDRKTPGGYFLSLCGIRDFDEAIRLNATDARTFVNRGIAYASMHDFDHAMADFAEANATAEGNRSGRQTVSAFTH